MRFLFCTFILFAVAPVAAAQRVPSPIGAAAPQINAVEGLIPAPARARRSAADGRTPSWVKWGLVGAGVGALTFPLLSTLASDSGSNVAADAAAGAVIGFVVVGGSVALWQAICGPGTSSRRAGMCRR